MKKLFLFILAAGALTTTFAQSRHDQDYAKERIPGSSNSRNAYGENNRRYDDRDEYNRRERAAQIERINRVYNARIYELKNSRWLRGSEKRRQVRALEAQRTAEIRRTANRYNNRNMDYYHDRYAKNNRRY
jgi:hypothetical protein